MFLSRIGAIAMVSVAAASCAHEQHNTSHDSRVRHLVARNADPRCPQVEPGSNNSCHDDIRGISCPYADEFLQTECSCVAVSIDTQWNCNAITHAGGPLPPPEFLQV